MRAVILVWDCLGSHLGTGCPAPGQGVSGRAWRRHPSSSWLWAAGGAGTATTGVTGGATGIGAVASRIGDLEAAFLREQVARLPTRAEVRWIVLRATLVTVAAIGAALLLAR